MFHPALSAVPCEPFACPDSERAVYGRLDHKVAAIRILAETIARLGGVIVTPQPYLQCHLIGHLAWLGPERVFWFEAHGRNAGAAHTLDYDELCRAGHRGVVLFHREQIVGYICTIEGSRAQDVACLKAAYEAWQVAAHRRSTTICELCRQAAPDAAFRRCVWRKCARGSWTRRS